MQQAHWWQMHRKDVTTLNSSLPNVLNNTWTLTGDSVTAWANKYVTFNTHAYQAEFNVKEDVQSA
jgi:iron complex outermembrane receptor protein